MSEVQETHLPGVGVRYDVLTSEGDRIGVLAHHFGHRELLVYDPDDPDSSRRIARLEPDDARTLADLLGVPHISQQLEGVQQRIEGLAIDVDADRQGLHVRRADVAAVRDPTPAPAFPSWR